MRGPVVGWDSGLGLVLEPSFTGMVQGGVGMRGEVEGYVEGLGLIVSVIKDGTRLGGWILLFLW